MAPSWRTVSTYPIIITTGPVTIDEIRHDLGFAGGSLIAVDGTLPMRALVRCVARREQRMWRRKNNNNNVQSMFMPKDLHITHVILYAVRPELTHNHVLFEK